jgi:hypothetical protein
MAVPALLKITYGLGGRDLGSLGAPSVIARIPEPVHNLPYDGSQDAIHERTSQIAAGSTRPARKGPSTGAEALHAAGYDLLLLRVWRNEVKTIRGHLRMLACEPSNEALSSHC